MIKNVLLYVLTILSSLMIGLLAGVFCANYAITTSKSYRECLKEINH